MITTIRGLDEDVNEHHNKNAMMVGVRAVFGLKHQNGLIDSVS